MHKSLLFKIHAILDSMITLSTEISLTLVGDGSSKEFAIDLRNLAPNFIAGFPQVPPTGIALSILIGPDGSTRVPAEITLSSNGRTISVKAETPLQGPGENLSRYTLNVVLLFPTD
jgi:hypothetical protein